MRTPKVTEGDRIRFVIWKTYPRDGYWIAAWAINDQPFRESWAFTNWSDAIAFATLYTEARSR